MPLRFPRPVIPVIAIGMAAVWVAAASAPALADQVRAQEFWLGQLNVGQAWQANQGTGITVAVLSDGVDAQQADLAGVVTTGPDFVTTGPDFTGTEAEPGVMGTEAASLIAGRGTGPVAGAGIIGIAPKARILSVQVTLDPANPALDSTAAGAALPGDIASGIRYAVAHGARVIDLPMDPGQPNPSAIAALPIPRFSTEPPQLIGIDAAEGGSSAEQQAVAFALSKGVVLVAPAGDNALGTDAPNYPAAYPGVISVGAFDSSFNRGAFSSNQPYVSVMAPGVGVTAASSEGGYTTVSSTAAASAIVSGIAALMVAQYPHLTPAQVRQALTTSTVVRPPGGHAAGSGTGSVDAGRAMLAAASLAAPASARAGARAQPLASPPPPVAAPVSSSLAPRLVRAGLISLGVLVVLLGAIFWYTRSTRRREEDSAQATADWARSTQNAFSAYGSSDSRTEADKMLEYFAAPSSNPTAASSPFGANSPFGASAATLTANRGASGSGTSGEAAASATSGLGAWSSVAPAPRAQSRQARVSGSPPWEPAAQPASELPWAAVPGTATGGRVSIPASGRGSDSVWPVTPSAAAAMSASSRSWEELAASSSAAAPAMPARDLTPPPAPDWDRPAAGGPKAGSTGSGGSRGEFSGPDFPAPVFPTAGFPAADRRPDSFRPDSFRPDRAEPAADGPARNGSAGNSPAGRDTPGSSSAAASPGASLWESVRLPRSPSGSNWEALDSGPENGLAAAGEALWPEEPGDDAYRPSPAGDGGWQPAAQWQPDAAAQWQPSPNPSAWSPGEEAAPSWPRAGSTAWSPASGDSWPAAASGRPWHETAAADDAEPFSWRPARRDEGRPPAGDGES